MDEILKVNVFCSSADLFRASNEVYRRYFPDQLPPRIFVVVPDWTGHSTSKSTASRSRSHHNRNSTRRIRRGLGVLGHVRSLHPRPGQVDCDLADAEMLTPELEQIDGLVDNVRYRSLTRGTADRARTPRPRRAPTRSRFPWRSPCPRRELSSAAQLAECAYPNPTHLTRSQKGGHFAARAEPDCSVPSGSARVPIPPARTHQTSVLDRSTTKGRSHERRRPASART